MNKNGKISKNAFIGIVAVIILLGVFGGGDKKEKTATATETVVAEKKVVPESVTQKKEVNANKWVGEMLGDGYHYFICKNEYDLNQIITYDNMGYMDKVEKFLEEQKCFVIMDKKTNIVISEEPKILTLNGMPTYEIKNVLADIHLVDEDKWINGFYTSTGKLKQPWQKNIERK